MNSEEKLSDYIEDYEEWVEKQIPVNGDWIDELNYMSSLREDIHDYIAKNQADPAELESIKSLDAKWQKYIASNLGKNFKYIDKPSGDYPNESWWWHIDRLAELSEQDRSTL